MEKFILHLKALLFLGLLLTNCSPAGYYYVASFEGHEELLLKKDGTFIQIMNWYNLPDTFYGKWSYRKDTVFLKILEPEVFFNDNSLSSVEEKILPNKDSIYFEVYFNNNEPALVHIVLDSIITLVTDTLGKAKIKRIEFSEMLVYSLISLPYITYKVKDARSNYFKIILYYIDKIDNPSMNIYRIEPDTIYILKGNKLIPSRSELFQLKRKIRLF